VGSNASFGRVVSECVLGGKVVLQESEPESNRRSRNHYSGILPHHQRSTASELSNTNRIRHLA